MDSFYDNAAKNFLELASHQRLGIIFRLLEEKSKVTMTARALDATSQEVSRNFDRLLKSGIIKKDTDGFYHLSTFGNAVCTQIPSLVFLSQNKKYFETHSFDGIPLKFVQRIGALQKGQNLKGFVKVQEQLKQIYQNATEYVYSIITEEPMDLIELAANKAKKGLLLHNILSQNTIVAKGRKNLLKKQGYNKLVADGQIKRKMVDSITTLVVLNENEACVMFPTNDGEADMSQTFYSDDKNFHEWCLDYFRYCWFDSDMFQESKIKED